MGFFKQESWHKFGNCWSNLTTLGRDDFNLTFMIFSGELPYDVGYPKKHIRPYGGGWGLLLYPAQQSPCWLNLKIGVFYFIFYFMSSDMSSIIVSYQNEHLQNIIVYCWYFPHPAAVLHWWLKIDPKWPKKPKIKNCKNLAQKW